LIFINTLLYENCIFLKELNENGYIIPDVLITPEQIQELSEACNLLSESIDFDYILQESFNIKEKISDILDRDLKKLFNNNDEIYAKAKIAVKSTASSIVYDIKNKGVKKESSKSIAHKLEELFKELEELLFESLDTEKLENGKYDVTKIKNALKAILYILISRLVFSIIFNLICGPHIANILGSCILAPITEELGKKFAASGNFEKEFFIIFNAYEFSGYIYELTKINKLPLLKAIRARTAAVLMHLSTTIIHWLSKNEKVQKVIKLDDAQSKTLGYGISVFIHALWNVLGKFSPKFVSLIVGK